MIQVFTKNAGLPPYNESILCAFGHDYNVFAMAKLQSLLPVTLGHTHHSHSSYRHQLLGLRQVQCSLLQPLIIRHKHTRTITQCGGVEYEASKCTITDAMYTRLQHWQLFLAVCIKNGYNFSILRMCHKASITQWHTSPMIEFFPQKNTLSYQVIYWHKPSVPSPDMLVLCA